MFHINRGFEYNLTIRILHKKSEDQIMETLTHSMTLDYPIDTLWKFVISFEDWAASIPGYHSHQKLNDQQYSLLVNTNFGFSKKQLLIQFKIMDVKQPSKVLFKLASENKTINGRGYLELSNSNLEQTAVFLRMDYAITGKMSPIIKSVIANSGKEKAEEAIKETVGSLLS